MNEATQRVALEKESRSDKNKLTSQKRMRLQAPHRVLGLPRFGAAKQVRTMYRLRFCFAGFVTPICTRCGTSGAG